MICTREPADAWVLLTMAVALSRQTGEGTWRHAPTILPVRRCKPVGPGYGETHELEMLQSPVEKTLIVGSGETALIAAAAKGCPAAAQHQCCPRHRRPWPAVNGVHQRRGADRVLPWRRPLWPDCRLSRGATARQRKAVLQSSPCCFAIVA